MNIVWDESKNELLKVSRGVSFEEVAQILQNHAEVDVVVNPTRAGQLYYVVQLHDYIHLVPFLVNRDGQIVLKTIFPSRKFEKLYGGTAHER